MDNGEEEQWHIYCTGHSMGGALACLAAYEISVRVNAFGAVPLTVYVKPGMYMAAHWIDMIPNWYENMRQHCISAVVQPNEAKKKTSMAVAEMVHICSRWTFRQSQSPRSRSTHLAVLASATFHLQKTMVRSIAYPPACRHCLPAAAKQPPQVCTLLLCSCHSCITACSFCPDSLQCHCCRQAGACHLASLQ